MKQGELGASLVHSFENLFGYNVLDWMPLDGGEPHRLTAAAHAAILEHAPDLDRVRAIVTKPLLNAFSKLMTLQGAWAIVGLRNVKGTNMSGTTRNCL